MWIFTSESPAALSWRTPSRESSCSLHRELYRALCLEGQQAWFQACQVQLGLQRWKQEMPTIILAVNNNWAKDEHFLKKTIAGNNTLTQLIKSRFSLNRRHRRSFYICFYRTAHYCIRMVPKLLQDCVTGHGLGSKKLGVGVDPERNIIYYSDQTWETRQWNFSLPP